jgi:hypothetical protein
VYAGYVKHMDEPEYCQVATKAITHIGSGIIPFVSISHIGPSMLNRERKLFNIPC